MKDEAMIITPGIIQPAEKELNKGHLQVILYLYIKPHLDIKPQLDKNP